MISYSSIFRPVLFFNNGAREKPAKIDWRWRCRGTGKGNVQRRAPGPSYWMIGFVFLFSSTSCSCPFKRAQLFLIYSQVFLSYCLQVSGRVGSPLIPTSARHGAFTPIPSDRVLSSMDINNSSPDYKALFFKSEEQRRRAEELTAPLL